MENKTTISVFAPVIIPTLCRYEMFKQCIESLSKCVGAEHTDVCVGLDYPAKESHWDGYKKIKEYLHNTKFNFRQLMVIEREYNYGLGPKGNIISLQNDILKEYDRFIFTEDDNIFSPNFLVYINTGLEKFKNDESIYAICGYKHPYQLKSNDNTFIKQNVDFSAWGYGTWKDRITQMPNPKCYFRQFFSLNNLLKIKKENGANRARDFLYFVLRPPKTMYDCPLSVFIYFEKKNVIVPSKISLVKNIGWDGSGQNCRKERGSCYTNQNISDEKTFDYIGTGEEYYEENKKIFRDNSKHKMSNLKFWWTVTILPLKVLIKKIFKIRQVY